MSGGGNRRVAGMPAGAGPSSLRLWLARTARRDSHRLRCWRTITELHANGAKQIALAHRPDEALVAERHVVHLVALSTAPAAGTGANGSELNSDHVG